MIELSTIRDLVAIFGVISGLTYYIMTVRNQNQSRKAQLLLSLHKEIADVEAWKRHRESNYWKWTDYEDFERKYGSDNNPEAYAIRLTDWYWMNNVGLMMKNNLIDEEMAYDMFGSSIIITWVTWKPIIMEQRVRYMGENWMEYFEYLGVRMISIQKSRDITWQVPKTGIEYVSDSKTP